MDFDSIFSRAQRLCSKSEKCEYDIHKKLYQWEVSVEDGEEIIRKLKEYDFINHRRYALSFVNDKLRFNHWGKKKIEYALKAKHIEEAYIEEALNSISGEYYDQIIQQEIEKKDKSLKTTSQKERKNKLCSYLLQKGFESGKVFESVENKLKENNN